MQREHQRVLPDIGTPKKTVFWAVKRMKADATYAEIMYELYVLRKINEGERDIREARVLTHVQMKKALGKWLK